MKNTPEYLSAKQNFKVYYLQYIQPALHQLEKERVKHLKIFLLILPLVIIWFGFSILNNNLTGGETSEENDFYGLAGNCVVLLLCWPMLSFHQKSKESILPLLAGFFGKIDYNYQSGFSEEVLLESNLIKSYDKFAIDDSFSGIYEETVFNITEYNLYISKIKPGYNRVTGFSNRDEKIGGGLLFYAKMNKNFEGQTLVVKDKGFFNRFLCPKNMQRISLESPEFEKKFEVYGNNQVESRYILTPVMMEYMLELTKTFSNVEFSFFKEHILVNIKTSENMFECSSFFTTILNQRRIEKSFEELYLLFSIINILRLNKKILL